MKKKLLLIHYNAKSKGSFVEKTLCQIRALRDEYSIVVMLPESGSFSRKLEAEGIVVVFRELHEKDSYLMYLFHFLAFLIFLLNQRVHLVYYLDYVWWKPAEVLAVKTLQIPSLAFCGFYKSKDELKSFISLINLVVVNSQKTFDVFRTNGFTKPLQVIHNFIDTKAFKNAVSIRSELIDRKRPVIAFVGTLHLIKGIEYAISAVSSIKNSYPDVLLILVGSAREDKYELGLRKIVEEKGLEDNVLFLGHRSDVYDVMSSVDVLLVPSLEEAFGYINIEAGLCELPVVASRVGGIPEIIVDGETGILVEPKNSEQIADACIELLGSKEERTRLGANAKKRVEKLFSADAKIPKWKSLIESLL